MTIATRCRRFGHDESGAVTVDWVVLTAAIVGLGFSVLAAVSTATQTVSENVSDHLGASEVSTAFP